MTCRATGSTLSTASRPAGQLTTDRWKTSPAGWWSQGPPRRPAQRRGHDELALAHPRRPKTARAAVTGGRLQQVRPSRDSDGVAPCSLTDGSPLTPAPAPVGDCVDIPIEEEPACRLLIETVQLDLGEVRRTDLVVLRSATGRVAASTSTDGRTWQPFAADDGSSADPRERRTVNLAADPRPVRYVRVEGSGSLTEVAVW